MNRLKRSSLVSAFARSFLIQGSWNYRTMIGSGFAFSMLPVLRNAFGTTHDELDRPLRRHLEHFNAHPYLSCLALGAAIRLEADSEDPEKIRRFKLAVRGPLGGLGDALVWASWLPLVSLVGLIVYGSGLVPGWVAVVVFLVLYNAGHLGLRLWGFRAGLSEGHRVGRHLGQASLGLWTRRIRSAATLFLGVLSGLIVAGEGGLGHAGAGWTALAAAGFMAGLFVGQIVWRPTAVAVVAATALVATWGVIL